MAFVSFEFLIFITAVIILYFCVPLRFRWVVLLAASYVFFFISSGWLILYHLAASLITFFTGLLIERVNGRKEAMLAAAGSEITREQKKEINSKIKKKAKMVTVAGALLVLCILLFLKYANFFTSLINGIFSFANVSIPRLSLLLPIGISFYTLQAIGYMVDVYRRKYKADRNLAKFLLFMSYFPQIVQGPFARHDLLADQLYEGHKFNYDRLTYGAQLILWGFMKKLIIADRIAVPVAAIFDHPDQYSGLIVFMAAAMYGLQVYTDFSGGIDIAIGFSEIIGIELQPNFRQPYFSTSIEEFWRRWHISLGRWMRDYVFYPLSLSKPFGTLSKKSRKILGQFIGKKLPTFLAMFIVYLLVGIWHGPEWRYIAYGIWNGIIIVTSILLENSYRKWIAFFRIKEESFCWRVFKMFRTFILCTIGRFFSRAGGFKAAAAMFVSVFHGIRDLSWITNGSLIDLGLSNANWILLLLSIIVLFVVGIFHERGMHIRERIAQQNLVFRWMIYIFAIGAVVVFGVWGPGYDSAAFIYEQF